ncbi:MAG: hypothetical protein KGL53_14455, partial [Elusimicrobia bacterium]|nr:hypothetical protein [Elusimicrobiota bacterium]
MTGRRLALLGLACLVVSSLLDCVRGPLLPLFAARYAAGYGRVAFFLAAGSLGSLAFNAASIGPLAVLSDRAFVALSAAAQAAALVLAAAAPGLGTLTAAGFVWGAGNTGLGMSANLLVIRGSSEAQRARLLSLLHVFYGLSCVLPPLYVARAHRAGLGLGLLIALPAALPAVLALGAGLLEPGHGAAPRLGVREALSDSPLAMGSVVALYVLGEVLTSMWLVALQTARGASLLQAGRTLSGFFLALAAGRAVTAALARPGLERRLVPLGLGGAAAFLLAAAGGRRWAFWAAGFCCGPVFPLLMTKLSLERPGRLRADLAFVYSL